MIIFFFFFFNDTATTEIYTRKDTLSLHDALPTSSRSRGYSFASIESSIGPIYAASLRHGTTIDTKGRTTDPEALVTLLMGAWPASGLIMPAPSAKPLPPGSVPSSPPMLLARHTHRG